MARAFKFAVVALCLLCIVAICIAPLVDLPATNLRSYQAVVMLLWGLIASAFVLAFSLSRLISGPRVASPIPFRRKMEWWTQPSLALSCILRC